MGFSGDMVVEMQVQYLSQKDPLEKEMATQSSILAWKIPWAEEPGRHSSWCWKELDTAEHTTVAVHGQTGL